jgi:hypothetical protein
MIRRSIDKTNLFTGTPGMRDMRSALALDGFVCATSEHWNYQQKPNGFGRTEQLD